MLKNKLSYWLACVGLAFFVVACDSNKKIENSFGGRTMGTTYSVKFITTEKSQIPEQAVIEKAVDSILKEVNRQMSTYIPTSEISLFNQATDIAQKHLISKEFAKVLQESINLHEVTQGALNITIGPLVNLWGFGPENRPVRVPTEQQLSERLASVGMDKFSLKEEADQYFLQKNTANLYIDLSAIAKGFGTDQVAEYLESLGIENYMVEIGGEIRAKGHNLAGNDWQIAIEKPVSDGSRAIQEIVSLKNMSMATSGDYRNYFEQDGIRYSHEIDPNTGRPIQHNLASITVITPSCMTADGLATGLLVLGAEKALDVAEKNNLAIYMVVKNKNGFETIVSSEFKKILNKK